MSDFHALKHEINISAELEAVRAALATSEGLQGWNTPLVQGTGEPGTEWILRYTGRPEFHWRIDSNAPRDIVWTCTQGPGNAVGTSAHFTLMPGDKGRTTVLLAHERWLNDGGNFTKCNTIWGALMHHLKEFAESGVSNPAFS